MCGVSMGSQESLAKTPKQPQTEALQCSTHKHSEHRTAIAAVTASAVKLPRGCSEHRLLQLAGLCQKTSIA